MAKKVTPELARIRGIPHGLDLRSPSLHPDILGGDDLLIKVEEMHEATGHRIKSQIGRYRIRGYGGARPLPHLAEFGFRRDVLLAGKDADVVPKVALKTEIGDLDGANPLEALDAGSDRADELRGAQRIDQARDATLPSA